MTTPNKVVAKFDDELTVKRLMYDTLKEDIDIGAGYYFHKEKLGECLSVFVFILIINLI